MMKWIPSLFSIPGILQGWKLSLILQNINLWEYQHRPMNLWEQRATLGHRNPVEGANLRKFLTGLSLLFLLLIAFPSKTVPHLPYSYIRQAENNLQFTCHALLKYSVDSRRSSSCTFPQMLFKSWFSTLGDKVGRHGSHNSPTMGSEVVPQDPAHTRDPKHPWSSGKHLT